MCVQPKLLERETDHGIVVRDGRHARHWLVELVPVASALSPGVGRNWYAKRTSSFQYRKRVGSIKSLTRSRRSRIDARPLFDLHKLDTAVRRRMLVFLAGAACRGFSFGFFEFASEVLEETSMLTNDTFRVYFTREKTLDRRFLCGRSRYQRIRVRAASDRRKSS